MEIKWRGVGTEDHFNSEGREVHSSRLCGSLACDSGQVSQLLLAFVSSSILVPTAETVLNETHGGCSCHRAEEQPGELMLPFLIHFLSLLHEGLFYICMHVCIYIFIYFC